MTTESFKEGKKPEKWKITFMVEKTPVPYVFRLSGDKDKIYSSVHFEGGIFKHPQDKKEIDLNAFVEALKRDFGVSSVVLSCCHPDKAREFLGNIDGVELIGSGDSEVRTVFNSIENKITIKPG